MNQAAAKTALEITNHAAANLQEWYHADPADCDLVDRDSQIEAWFERLFDGLKKIEAAFQSESKQGATSEK